MEASYVSKLCPPPQVVQDFCLEELYPHIMFRYMAPRQVPVDDALQLCSIVHSPKPSAFALQLDADRRVSDRISADLSAVYGSERRDDFIVTEEFLHPGVPVAARYVSSDDLRWYRAIIVNVDRSPGVEKPVRLRFVDFGNYQQNNQSQLKMLPIDMGNEPPLAIKGRMEGTVEDEEFERPILDSFRNWTQQVLKDHRCLVNFLSFDAAANQYVVSLFNANDGVQYTLPPGGRIQPRVPSDSTALAVEDLISLDDITGGGELVDLLSSDLACASLAPTAVKASKFEEELKSIFETAAVSGAADNAIVGTGEGRIPPEEEEDEGPKPECADIAVQTDISLIKKLEQAESAEGGSSPTYDPFSDPRYKHLVDKYPNLVKYLKGNSR